MTDSDDEALPAPVTMDTLMSTEEKKLLPAVKKVKKTKPQKAKKTTLTAAAKPSELPTKQRLTLSESDLPDSAENIKQDDDIIGWKANVGCWRKVFLLTKYESVGAMKTELENWVLAMRQKHPDAKSQVPKEELSNPHEAGPDVTPTRKRKRRLSAASDEEKASRKSIAVEFASKTTATPTADESWKSCLKRRLVELAKEVPDYRMSHMQICGVEYKRKPSS